jgi:hypothetical protein
VRCAQNSKNDLVQEPVVLELEEGPIASLIVGTCIGEGRTVSNGDDNDQVMEIRTTGDNRYSIEAEKSTERLWMVRRGELEYF